MSVFLNNIIKKLLVRLNIGGGRFESREDIETAIEAHNVGWLGMCCLWKTKRLDRREQDMGLNGLLVGASVLTLTSVSQPLVALSGIFLSKPTAMYPGMIA